MGTLPARADLGAFDPSQPLPAPLQLPLLSAVDDAAIHCTPEQWRQVADLHREHLVEWYRGPDALRAGNAAADTAFAAQLGAAFADDAPRRESVCAAIALHRFVASSRRGLAGIGPVRGAVLRALRQACDGTPDPPFAAAPGGTAAPLVAGAPSAAERIAAVRACLERAAGTGSAAMPPEDLHDPSVLTRALQPSRPALEAAIGTAGADDLLAALAGSQDAMTDPWRQPLFESILRHATRLTADERSKAIEAFEAARRERRDALAGRAAATGPWAIVREAIGERLRARLAAAIGEPRAAALFEVATPWDTGTGAGDPNAERDRLLGTLADDAGVAAVATECGADAWHPSRVFLAVDAADALHLAKDWTRAEVLACLRGAPGAGDDAVVDALLHDHAARAAAIRGKSRTGGWLRELAAAMHAEDQAMLAAVRAAFGEDRVDPEAIALVRLGRIERTLPIDVQGAMVAGVGWVEPPMPAGSIAWAALGLPQRTSPAAPPAACAELRRALVPRVDAFADARTGAFGMPPRVAPAPGEPPAPPAPRGRAFAQAHLERVQQLVDELEARANEGSPAARVAAAVLLAATYRPIATDPRLTRGLQVDGAGVPPEALARAQDALFRQDARPHDVVAALLEELRATSLAERDDTARAHAARIHSDRLRADWLGWAQAMARAAESARILRAAGSPAAKELLEP